MKKKIRKRGSYLGIALFILLLAAGCGVTDRTANNEEDVVWEEENMQLADHMKDLDFVMADEGKAEREIKEGADMQASDLIENAEADGIDVEEISDERGTADAVDFSVRLFKQCIKEGENTLVSPFSVLCTLAMTANGAKGETLEQMEKVLGADRKEWNDYLRRYISRLPMGEGYKMNIANSIWLRDAEAFVVEPDFLQTNGEHYGAGVYRAPFNDSTVRDINGWVSEHTDGMVRNMLNEIPEDAVMYLMNAIAFDAEWSFVYMENDVRGSVFTREDGRMEDVELMYSDEYQYLKDDNAQGFMKYYKGRKYAFAALLPDEGVGVADYVKSLTGERLLCILNHVEDVKVDAAVPKFENDYSVEMSNVLEEMGIIDAFDAEQADFSGIGSYQEKNLFINKVLHKTFIGVNEQGTKAGAATMVVAAAGAAPDEEIKVVHLDRPFVYMIIDCETNLPMFIGVMASVE